MKIRLNYFGGALLAGYILMVGSTIYFQDEMQLLARALIAVGLIIVWLIMGGIVFGVFRIMFKKIPESESIMEREHDERSQKIY